MIDIKDFKKFGSLFIDDLFIPIISEEQILGKDSARIRMPVFKKISPSSAQELFEGGLYQEINPSFPVIRIEIIGSQMEPIVTIINEWLTSKTRERVIKELKKKDETFYKKLVSLGLEEK